MRTYNAAPERPNRNDGIVWKRLSMRVLDLRGGMFVSDKAELRANTGAKLRRISAQYGSHWRQIKLFRKD